MLHIPSPQAAGMDLLETGSSAKQVPVPAIAAI